MPVSRGASQYPVYYPAWTNRPRMLDASTLAWTDGGGVPQTRSLSVITGSEYDITTPGQVVEGKDIQCSVIFKAPGAILRQCRIQNWAFYGVLADSGAYTVSSPADWALIEDCLVDNPSSPSGGTCIANSAFTARRCTIQGGENGFDLYHDTVVEDCLVYNLYNLGGSHADCIQTSSGGASSNHTIRRNRLYSRGVSNDDGTSCVICAVGSTSFTNITIDDNVMAGGSFSLYGPQSTTGTNVRITNNKFSTIFNPTVGAFGPWTDATDETISGNVIVDANLNFIQTLP